MSMHDMMGSILLVEDDVGVQKFLTSMLTKKGYKVEPFSSAEDALERLDAGNAVSLMVLDVALPGMNGIALADWIKTHRPGLPVLFISGDPGQIVSPGFITIPKPIDKKEFLDHVWQHI